ncbi:helix-turn-helix domain-containing protein [Streptomyces sp. NPDC046805]|uniref:helix-turn-helix domain-containing protein n=1 Tax=Streptomyces sp. NPDC046805 TaxID=3155134 RepID=UPI0033E36FE3
MSDTTTDGPRTLHSVPAPEPLAELTGAPAAIYTELVNHTGDEGATAAELALAAGLGRSTTGKALVTLEEHGMAVRTPGGHDGPRRTPDRWRAAPTFETNSDDGPGAPEPTPTEPEPSTADTPQPDTSHTDSGNILVDATTPDNEETSSGGGASATTASTDGAPHNTPHQDGKQPDEDTRNEADAHHDGGNEGPDPEDTPAPQTDPEQPPTASAEAAVQPGEKRRLAPGALRQMVINHLQAHPDEAFTATKISRVIEKSSGAIANSLDKLVKQGIAQQVSERPRTYRMAMPETNG